MREVPVVVVLGERGSGKSVALDQERALLADDGVAVASLHLGQDVSDTISAGADLRQHLTLPEDRPVQHVLLDGLDEGMSAIPNLEKVLLRELRQTQPELRAKLRLRIVCRTTRWPEVLERGLRELWPGDGRVALMALAPLTRQHIEAAAEAHVLDGAAFAEQVSTRVLAALAEQPATLIPLLKSQEQGERLPDTVAEAYGQACRTLCTETWQQGFEQRQNRPAADDLLEVARWTAAVLQFSRSTALSDEEPRTGDVHLDVLSGTDVPGLVPEKPCGRTELQHLTESGLFAPVGQRRWVFAHRSYQEHLAAEFLRDRIAPEVRRELLWAGSGPARHILPEHEEVAARLAVGDPDLFDELVAHDPWVALLADLPALPDDRRRQATQALLDTAADTILGHLEFTLLARLDHPGLAEQLTPFLTSQAHPNGRYLALWVAAACQPTGLTAGLLSLAEDAEVPVNMRAFALDAIAKPDYDQDALTRLHSLSLDDKPSVAAAALEHLWPGQLTLTEYLDRLPPRESWRYETRLEQFMELITPENVDAALSWAVDALGGDTSKAVLAIGVLAQSVRLLAHPVPGMPAPSRQNISQGLLALAASDDLLHTGDARTAVELLRQSLSSERELRRLLAGDVLHNGDQEHAEELVFSTETGLFPEDDLLYWAEGWPQLPPHARHAARRLISNRPRPLDDALRQAVEAARQADPELHQDTRWWDAPPPEWQLRKEERESEQRCLNTFDEEEFTRALAAVHTADRDQVRRAWLTVLGHLHKTHDGSRAKENSRLGAVAAAPSCPPEGSPLHADLVEAGLHVLRTAPVWNSDDVSKWGTEWHQVPELTAAVFVTEEEWEATLPTTGVARWAGSALALATMTPLAPDQELHDQLFEQCARHAGPAFETALAACLDRLDPYRLTELVRFLHRLRAQRPLTLVREWAADPTRPSESWTAVMTALTRLDGDAALPELQRVVAAGPAGHPDDRERWITAVRALMSLATLPASWPRVRQAVDADNDLFRDVMDRALLHTRPTPRSWPGIAALSEADLADFYARLCRREELHRPRPERESGVVYSHTAEENLHDLADVLAELMADKATPQAASHLARLATSGTTHNPDWLRRLARSTAREAARKQSTPLPAHQLRKLASDHALRVITDEAQLLDVVMEALDHVQDALSGPNGMAILLWNRAASKEVGAMWPTWEEDFSDLVMGLLKIHLAGRRVVLNREVQIDRPGAGGGRTDIHIQAAAPHPQAEPLTVVIECKGCWNPGLSTALTTQLVDRYLRRPHTAGVFLIGFFDCELWDPQSRPCCSPRHTKEEIERRQHDQAAQHQVPVLARILDCRPPGAQTTETTPVTSRSSGM
ncbi:hypothetical protein [Streptomyces sp. NPDC057580]|uniref:hypothetical protein n=1 Tax=Streptomyces sp. NPDC057580 TaxID=3346173 RepID=UPI0036B6304C